MRLQVNEIWIRPVRLVADWVTCVSTGHLKLWVCTPRWVCFRAEDKHKRKHETNKHSGTEKNAFTLLSTACCLEAVLHFNMVFYLFRSLDLKYIYIYIDTKGNVFMATGRMHINKLTTSMWNCSFFHGWTKNLCSLIIYILHRFNDQIFLDRLKPLICIRVCVSVHIVMISHCICLSYFFCSVK